MAAMFPEKPAGALPPETGKVFRLLKRSLPDDDYAVWQRLVIGGAPEPDFLVRHRSGRFLLIKVSTSDAAGCADMPCRVSCSAAAACIRERRAGSPPTVLVCAQRTRGRAIS
jgi:hypothetical protein